MIVIALLSAAGVAALILIVTFVWPGLSGGRIVDLNKIRNGPETGLTVNQGSILQYSYRLHESVGFTADYTLSDSTVISLKENKTTYLHSQNMLPGMTGGDDARGTFVFRAEKPGTVELTVEELFRGKTESTYKFKIVVR